MIKCDLRKPCFIVNPKSYLYGDDILNLARITDKLAIKYALDVFFTAQLIDLPKLVTNTKRLLLTAQHMDSLTPGKGMGRILPEALKHSGISAVILNHAEKSLTLAELDKSIRRTEEVGLISIVCADTVRQCKSVAELEPDIIICEPSSLIETETISESSYRRKTTEEIKNLNNDILVIQGAGVSNGEDVKRVMYEGADGTGGTSGIIKANSWKKNLMK